jgi:nicotinic acid phosphoribosyltransferase
MRNLLYRPNDLFAVARDEAEVDNLLNTDVYKFLMLDFILANPEYRDLEVKRKMTIRSKDVKTALVIPKEALIEQLEATKKIS